MTEPTPSSPFVEQALQRLRKLAEGNGLAPDAIQFFSAEEKTYTLEGTIILSPLFETSGGRYPGAPRGQGCRVLASGAALKAEVEKLRQAFQTKPAWITEAAAQLKEQPAGGWGLDDVRIPLSSQNAVLAATETCPSCQGGKMLTCQQCQGQGEIVCPQCQGARQEHCPICNGSGHNPVQPDQICINCNGLRYAPCRFCHGRGQLPCPTCKGQRGTPCPNCKATGTLTEEVSITCGARTQFRLKGEGLPSGLRRGLDRLGMANLAKGHAEIESIAPPPDEEDDSPPPPPVPGETQKEAKKEKPLKPELYYLAHMPYADLKMNFAGKRAVVGVFGKRAVLLGVPAFLDKAMETPRQELQKAAKDEGNLDRVLQFRLMKDALKLQIAGTATVNALRRIYPQGLSPEVAAEILKNMRLALNKLTLRSRSLAAVGMVVVAGVIFAGIFLTPFHQSLTQGVSVAAGAGIDLGILLAVMAGGWFALSAATRLVLQKRFPDFTIPLKQKTGKTGYAMLAGIVALYVAVILLSPTKAGWLHILLD